MPEKNVLEHRIIERRRRTIAGHLTLQHVGQIQGRPVVDVHLLSIQPYQKQDIWCKTQLNSCSASPNEKIPYAVIMGQK